MWRYYNEKYNEKCIKIYRGSNVLSPSDRGSCYRWDVIHVEQIITLSG